MESTRPSWSFLTNHGAALLYVARQPRATLREIASAVGITERATTRIIKDLRDAGYLTATREGRRNSYAVNLDAPLLHPVTMGHSIRELVEALNRAA